MRTDWLSAELFDRIVDKGLARLTQRLILRQLCRAVADMTVELAGVREASIGDAEQILREALECVKPRGS